MKTKKRKKKMSEFNWFVELEAAIKKEPSSKKFGDLDYRANWWVSCACGQLCKKLPRDKGGKPKDEQLSFLGSTFCVQVQCRLWGSALKTLHRIEKRTAFLLNELKQASKAK